MSAVAELEAALQSLLALKAPGVTKTKIEVITMLCINNIRDESILIQKIYTHFRKTPPTHKLGVLYVVDSVTRQWIEKARQNGQDIPATSPASGTFASGVQKITELMPVFVNETIAIAPQDQKDKIRKLIDIWVRSSTFPAQMLADFTQKVIASQTQEPVRSFTPAGSPPPGLLASLGFGGNEQQSRLQTSLQNQHYSEPQPPFPFGGSIASQFDQNNNLYTNLQNLGNHQAQPSITPIHDPSIASPHLYTAQQAYAPPTAAPQPASNAFAYSGNQQASMAAAVPTVNLPPEALAALSTVLPAHVINDPALLQQRLQLLQALQSQGIPQNQWAQVIALVDAQAGNTTSYSQPIQPPVTVPPPVTAQPSWITPDVEPVWDRDGGFHQIQPNTHGRQRDRSRSPDHSRDRIPGTRRRDSPVYGVYNPNGSNGPGPDGHGHGHGRANDIRNAYRQRSPRSRTATPPGSSRPKYISVDPSVPDGHIKVLSRTLFVGGVAGTEQQLRDIFGRFGEVQSCIVNHDKRHAFVKMVDRAGSEAAKEGMDSIRDPEITNKARQTRWGVGFGPRECNDYNTGISVIPIDSLTDADRKWMLTAEFGGTGGKPIISRMVVEEPDIEIGAGVSSKAISRRMPVGGQEKKGGFHGARHSPSVRPPKRERYQSPKVPAEQNNVGVPPPVPGFGFQFPMNY